MSPLEREEGRLTREEIAAQIARETYDHDDDVDVLPGRWRAEEPEPLIESVDGGYWVQARVWVDADSVEERFDPGLAEDKKFLRKHGEG